MRRVSGNPPEEVRSLWGEMQKLVEARAGRPGIEIQHLTWTAALPADGTVPVAAMGPTFWFGGPVNDPNSLFGQAYVEPSSIPTRW